MWTGPQAWASSGPSEKPASTSSRQGEGFSLGCRWMGSPKDIPVPEEIAKRIERLKGGPMIESERDIRILISQWQEREFRRFSNSVSECSRVSTLAAKEKISEVEYEARKPGIYEEFYRLLAEDASHREGLKLQGGITSIGISCLPSPDGALPDGEGGYQNSYCEKTRG